MNGPICTLEMSSPVGKLLLVGTDRCLSEIRFGGGESCPSPVLYEAKRQLEEYFAGTRRSFVLPLCIEGTEFQRKVWSALADIPYGETRSYADIAAAVGSPKACRAVGTANNRNRLPIVIPCHRAIGSDGKLSGYAGGPGIKEALLRLESGFAESSDVM